MIRSSETLATRRRELLARCAEQRRTMTLHSRSLSQAMSKFDRAFALVARIRQHPGIIAGIVIVTLIAFKPRRLVAMISTSAIALRMLRAARTMVPIVQSWRARR